MPRGREGFLLPPLGDERECLVKDGTSGLAFKPGPVQWGIWEGGDAGLDPA